MTRDQHICDLVEDYIISLSEGTISVKDTVPTESKSRTIQRDVNKGAKKMLKKG